MAQEANITLDIQVPRDPKDPKTPITKSMDTFFNPIMQSNRNISIALLTAQYALDKKSRTIALPLAGSGIRALRFLDELPTNCIQKLFINDQNPKFKEQFKNALAQNKLNSKSNQTTLHLHNLDANIFLLKEIGFDYIEIDPFGSPNPFLSAAINKINRGGILAVTATDTAALAGTYPKACRRKYWATPLKCFMMHEIGLRILIRKIQLMGVQFNKVLTPILSYQKDHYYRVYFESSNSKSKCDEIQKMHQYLLYNPKTLETLTSTKNILENEHSPKYQVAGPLWAGPLHNEKLLNTITKQRLFESETPLISKLQAEAQHPNVVGFIDSHLLSKKHKIKIPTNEDLLSIDGTWKTQFSKSAIKTHLPISELIKKLKTK